jgi:DNA-binding CsgD family transcriptional regulator
MSNDRRGRGDWDLLERKAELDAIRRHVDEAPTGPAVLVLDGEPGIGKTVLWSAGVAYARERALTVITSSPSGGETQLSFSVLVDLFGGEAEAVLPTLPAPQRNALKVALRLSARSETAPDELTIAAATLGAIVELSRGTSLILAIDDVQWLDGPSAAALSYAVRRLEGPVLLLLGHRAGEPQPLDDAGASLRTQEIRVGPLSAPALNRLIHERVGVSLPRNVLTRVKAISEGNPFYALELARTLERRSEPLDPDSPLPVPDSLQGLVQDRLGGLPDATKELLAVVAALSAPTLGDVEVAGVGESIDDAVRAGLLVADGERLRFAHPLFASGSYSLLGPRARRALHRRLAEIAPEGEERARHLALGVDGPSEEVAQVLHEAARQAAARGAIATAAELAEKAVHLTPAGLDDGLAARRLDAASYQYRHGDLAQAHANVEPLLRDRARTQTWASASLQLARLERNPERALVFCERAIPEAETDALRAEAHQLAAEMSMLTGHVPRALEHARMAADLAERAGATALLIESLGTVCHYETYTGNVTPGLIDRAVELERDALRPSNNYSPREILGLRLMYADGLDKARELLEHSLTAATDLGDEIDRWSLLVHLTQLECRAGRLSRAREHAREAEIISHHTGTLFAGATGFVRALIAAHLGQVEEARRAGTEGAASAGEEGNKLFRALNIWALGFLELSLGDSIAADAHLRPLPDELERMGYENPGVRPVYADAIEARIGSGDLDVDLLIERLESRGRMLEYPWALAVAGRCRGLLLAARGELPEAIAELERALFEHEHSPQPLERGRTLLALGATRRRAKRRGEARSVLTEALELFDVLGAPLWAERASAELARIPGRAPVARDLSETERRVAELVASGLANKEVAAKMFVTVRTIEGNLTRIYSKLGVRSRTELAAMLGRQTSS